MTRRMCVSLRGSVCECVIADVIRDGRYSWEIVGSCILKRVCMDLCVYLW